MKVSGLKQCLHIGKVFPFHTESEVSRQAQLDANRAAQQLIRSTETPEARQARLQQDAASHHSSRASAISNLSALAPIITGNFRFVVSDR